MTTRRLSIRLFIVLLSTLSWPAQMHAAETAVPTVQMVRTETAPNIDGKLNEAEWSTAATIDELYQIRPGDRAPPSEKTVVYVMYDKDALYIAARMTDSEPNKITRNIMKQGSGLAEDDRLAIILDPFNTGRQGYRFEVNANGVRNDMLYQNNQLQSEWTVIWEAAGALTEDGWTAEMAIPFKTLPFDPSIESWGFNVSRAIRRRGEEMIWVSRNRTWNPSIVGTAAGLKDLDQGVGLDVVPSMTVTHRKSYMTGESNVKGEPSLDAYYRITPALSGSITINTDFSATEVDDRQVNLTRFNLFFPEKRDFFLNDADLFEFGRIGIAGFLTNNRSVGRPAQENGRPFFPRKIGLSAAGTPVDLDYGAKLSGRIGAFNIGALAVRQDEFQQSNGSFIDPTTAAVVRVAANVFAESSVGFIATSGNPADNRSNTLVGADFLFLNTRILGNRTLEGDAWLQQSNTEGLEGEDAAFGLGIRFPSADGWRGGLGWRQVERNFFPGLGFVNRTDIRDLVADTGYTHFIRGSTLQSVYAGVDGQQVSSLTTGDTLTEVVTLRPIELETRGRDLARAYFTLNEERVIVPFTIYRSGTRSITIPVGSYDFSERGFDVSTGAQRRYAGRIYYRGGDFYTGERVNLGTEFAWKQSRYFTLRTGFDWNRVRLPQGDFITRVMRATSEVGFSSRLNWISLFQYDDVSEIFGIHSRLVWIPKAGNEFFLVLNRNFQDVDKNNSFQSVTSELSAKANYTFRF